MMEADIAAMDPEEKALFLADLGVEESGLDRLIQASYTLLGLISYLTCRRRMSAGPGPSPRGPKRPRPPEKSTPTLSGALSGPRWSPLPTWMACGGSMTAAKEKGLVRSEGKEYVMQDGDVVLFRFNV